MLNRLKAQYSCTIKRLIKISTKPKLLNLTRKTIQPSKHPKIFFSKEENLIFLKTFDQSVVHNMEASLWLILPVYHKIYQNGKGIFAARTRKLVNGDEVESRYSIYNASGELLHDKKHAGDLPKEVLDWLDPLILE